MNTWITQFTQIDQRITRWMADNGITLLRISVGIVFVWFGVLKFVPGLSPADELATRTIATLSFGLVQPDVSRPTLALWETLIGLGLISGRFMRATLLLLFLQMVGTVTPLFLFPAETWSRFPFAPTLEGQYIIKNIVLVSAGLVIGATVRGGGLVDDPVALRRASQAH
ncbi:MAG TPA: DoxX family membrane protein [Aggregatilineales bacterium]|nr:DoxX family membrane protein [Aggregatilineales bacterium]